MEYSMQVDEFEIDNEPQSDEEIRRRLGWYLVPFNAADININVDAQAINDSQSR